MTRSIRSRLFLVLGIAIVVQSLAVAVAVYRYSMIEADELFDAQLARSARILAQMVEPFVDPDSTPSVTVTPTFPDSVGHPYERKLIYQVWDDRGRLLLRSANAPAEMLVQRVEGYADIQLQQARWRLFSLHDPVRRLWFVTGESAEIRGELSAEIAVTALAPLAIGLLALVAAAVLAGSYALAGIRQVSAALRRREPDHLEPIDETRAPTELRPLVAALNRLMERVRRVLLFERRFIADAAHELRTPLAALRIHLENAIHDDDPQSHRESLRQTAQAMDRLTRLVDQLLILSRLDPDAPLLERSRFDVGSLAREVIAELAPLADTRGTTVALEEPAPVTLPGMPLAFQSLIRNLVDNAIRYAPAGSQVVVRVQPGELQVVDQGAGIPEPLRDRIFDRFVRHGRTSDGSGLGLSIVRRVAELHGAHVETTATEDRHAVTVRWSSCPAATAVDPGTEQAPGS